MYKYMADIYRLCQPILGRKDPTIVRELFGLFPVCWKCWILEAYLVRKLLRLLLTCYLQKMRHEVPLYLNCPKASR